MSTDGPTAAVVGAGPAGLMAAEGLAAGGMRVTVHDHMPSAGRKLLLAGRGGLNLTHSEPLDRLLTRYGAATPRLVDAVRAFGPRELRDWCTSLGEPTFVGTSGRVFPRSFRATPLLRAWLVRLTDSGVQFELRDRWSGWRTTDGIADPSWSRFERDGHIVETPADVTILAMGGASWPRVGSDGGWVPFLRGAGVQVNELRPANCGVVVEWSAPFADRFGGVPLKNVALDVHGSTARGDVMVTERGLEAGPVYAQSAAIRDTIAADGHCLVTIDLQPDLSVDEVARRLAHRRAKESRSNSLRRTIGLAPVAIGMLREATGNRIPVDTAELAAVVKAVPLRVFATMPIERAISSAGGVALAEVDERFMLTRLPGTFVAGEMLDWEAPTGGYLLQATFSTAVAAARGALAWSAAT